MQRSDEIDARVQSALGQFGNHRNVQYQVRRFVEKRLTGGEAAVMVVSFVFLGVFGGALSAAGEDLWRRIKALFKEMGEPKSHETDCRFVLTLKESVSGRSVEFQYSVHSTCDLDALDLFLEKAEAALSEVQNSHSHPTTDSRSQETMRFLFDGKTMGREWE